MLHYLQKYVLSLAVLAGILCPAHSQITKFTPRMLDRALGNSVLKEGPSQAIKFDRTLGVFGFKVNPAIQNTKFSLGFGYGNYNPVLGYRTSLTEQALSHKHASSTLSELPALVQVAPKTTHDSSVSTAFVSPARLTLPQITQAIYLWRLSNPGYALRPGSALLAKAESLIKEEWAPKGESLPLDNIGELPNITFLRRLLDPAFTPKTYGQLAEETKVYPKHVTLSVDGIPEPTPQAAQARLLDNYLMLSHPQVMGQYNTPNVLLTHNLHYYTPFVLTQQELSAAEELLTLRHAVIAVPANPTVRQLLEIAYNRLETHTVAYSNPQVQAYELYIAYPAYPRTDLYRAVKHVINQAENSVWRESTDVSHLVVLDALMGGVDFQNVAGLNRVMDSFEKLCKELPATEQNIAHLERLHAVLLRTAFWDHMPGSLTNLREEFDALSDWEYENLHHRVLQFKDLDVTQLVRK